MVSCTQVEAGGPDPHMGPSHPRRLHNKLPRVPTVTPINITGIRSEYHNNDIDVDKPPVQYKSLFYLYICVQCQYVIYFLFSVPFELIALVEKKKNGVKIGVIFVILCKNYRFKTSVSTLFLCFLAAMYLLFNFTT